MKPGLSRIASLTAGQCHCIYIYIFPNLIKVEIKLKLISLVKAFSETHGRSVEGGKTASKAFKNGEEDPWDATLE